MGTSFFRFITKHAFDRQTDRQTERPSQYRALHYMQSHSTNYDLIVIYDLIVRDWPRICLAAVVAWTMAG